MKRVIYRTVCIKPQDRPIETHFTQAFLILCTLTKLSSMLFCSIVLTILASGLASQETHRFIHIGQDGKEVSQDIIHDKDENTVMVIIGDVSMYNGYIPTVNLHDFNTRYVAFKDIRNKICMVSETPYPNAMPELYRSGVTNITVEYQAKDDPNPLSYTEVKLVAGTKIADFCKDYNTVLRELIPMKQIQKRDDVKAGNEVNASPCVVCLWCVVHNDPENVVG
ncbi:uncharacterized protein LOC123554854 isoform X2 [Mercenaria mercenaria]|uniref:uncharacterized protein LOC123554854 isoform X2 n=1 Tax=Mercenaria mercenaria TaxID=6596 RepID=UPI00234F4C34|nr:uncharacterized protein LOC123554854 isoform X2 [Mercenaria mercenaria]